MIRRRFLLPELTTHPHSPICEPGSAQARAKLCPSHWAGGKRRRFCHDSVSICLTTLVPFRRGLVALSTARSELYPRSLLSTDDIVRYAGIDRLNTLNRSGAGLISLELKSKVAAALSGRELGDIQSAVPR